MTTRLSDANAEPVRSKVSMTADGGRIAYWTLDGEVPADMNGNWDVYVLDRASGTRILASAGPTGTAAGGFNPALSADGTAVAFEGTPTLVIGTGGNVPGIFVRDLVGGTTRWVSQNAANGAGNNSSLRPALSGNGGFASFNSTADNLVPGDTNGVSDIFVGP